MTSFHFEHDYVSRTKDPPGTAGRWPLYIARPEANPYIEAYGMPNSAEDAEKWLNERETKMRKNARVLDTLIIGLPRELPLAQNIALVRRYLQDLTGNRCAWFFGIHRQEPGESNPHAHIIIHDRDLETGKAVCLLSQNGSTARIRALWGKHLEAALQSVPAATIDFEQARRDQLERFKTDINLVAFAMAHGYEKIRAASSRNSIALKNPGTGDKIIVARNSNGHWIYFSVHHGHSGTIVDFTQAVVLGAQNSMGHVRQELLRWAPEDGEPDWGKLPKFAQKYAADASNTVKQMPKHDPEKVLAEIKGKMRIPKWEEDRDAWAEDLSYLLTVRGIPEGLLQSPRFKKRIAVKESWSGACTHDANHDVVFLHSNQRKVEGQKKAYYCGGEICRPDGQKRQIAGGMKTLWLSEQRKDDTQLVITESAIDALSYAALHGYEHARFASTGGRMSPEQPKHLIRIMKAMPENGEIILAFDNDNPGHEFIDIVQDLFAKHVLPQRQDLRLRTHMPEKPDDRPKYDWNDVLKDSVAQASPVSVKRGHSGPPPPGI